MTEGNFTPENNLQEKTATKVPEKATGFQPETTEEIIADLTPQSEKKPNSLLGYLKSNTLRLAPLVLLASSIMGGAKMYQGGGGGGDDAGGEVLSTNMEMSPQAKMDFEHFQERYKEKFADIKSEGLHPANYSEKGIVRAVDEKGNYHEDGSVDVKAYPGITYSDGTKVEVIGKIANGTQIEGGILKSGSLNKKDPNLEYYEFSCNSVKGEFKDPLFEEKIVQLDENTICVVPWRTVSAGM